MPLTLRGALFRNLTTRLLTEPGQRPNGIHRAWGRLSVVLLCVHIPASIAEPNSPPSIDVGLSEEDQPRQVVIISDSTVNLFSLAFTEQLLELDLADPSVNLTHIAASSAGISDFQSSELTVYAQRTQQRTAATLSDSGIAPDTVSQIVDPEYPAFGTDYTSALSGGTPIKNSAQRDSGGPGHYPSLITPE